MWAENEQRLKEEETMTHTCLPKAGEDRGYALQFHLETQGRRSTVSVAQ